LKIARGLRHGREDRNVDCCFIRAGRFAAGATCEGVEMFYWAAVFLVIALVAGVLGFGGIAGVSSNIAWVLFIVGLVLALIFFLRGRAP
jgi:uncharacterized membrane protein YtjA (UPF0391 family)